MRFKLWALLWGWVWDSFDFHFLKVTDLDSVCVCVDFTSLKLWASSILLHTLCFQDRACVRECVRACAQERLCTCMCCSVVTRPSSSVCIWLLSLLCEHLSQLSLGACSPSQILCDLLSTLYECVSQKCWSKRCLDAQSVGRPSNDNTLLLILSLNCQYSVCNPRLWALAFWQQGNKFSLRIFIPKWDVKEPP
jgi:hypothetical protein